MKVLYPTDGSTPAIDAGQLFCRIADPTKVEVTVLTIAVPTYEDERDLMHAQAVAEITAGRLAECGFPVREETGIGHPASQILHRIEDDGYDMIIVGAGGTPWMDRIVIGGVSTRLLHESPTSLLLVHRQDHHGGPVHVVFGTDGSADATLAFELFRGFADPDDLTVRVLSVLELPDTSLAPLGPFMMPVPLDEHRKAPLMQHAWDVVQAATEDALAHGFKAEADVIIERPTTGLLDASAGADLLVLGSRGMGALGRVFLGSVSDRVARHAPATFIGRAPASRPAPPGALC